MTKSATTFRRRLIPGETHPRFRAYRLFVPTPRPQAPYEDDSRVEFRDRDNIQLSELKALKSGEGIVVFEDQQIRSNSIFIPDDEKISKMNVKINRYVPLRRPDFSDLCVKIPAAERRHPVSPERVKQILDICQTTAPDKWQARLNARSADKALLALTAVASDLDNRCDIEFTPEERGIVLFETAVEALTRTGGRYQWLREQPHIRISKKRIEEAHQNNATAGASGSPYLHTPAFSSVPGEIPFMSPPRNETNNDDWYQNFTSHAFTDDYSF